jgi:tetratricopeptide (TPR) repeat protein
MEAALRRSAAGFQEVLQARSWLATMAAMVALPGLCAFVTGHLSWSWSDWRVTPAAMGLLLGYEVRRSIAHAVAPEVADFAAHGRKARMFAALAILFAPLPELSSPDATTYGLALALGVLVHACLRAFHRRARIPPQRFGPAMREQLSVAEDKALDQLVHPLRFWIPARQVDTFAGNLIGAVNNLEHGKILEANDCLRRAFVQAPNDTERSKPVVIEAAVAEALGDEDALASKLREARVLYGNCTVATVAEIVLAPDTPKPVEECESDLLRLLHAETVARGHPETLTNVCVARVLGVNRLLFRVAKARAYVQLKNLNEAGAILDDVLSIAPRHGLARLHKGMELLARSQHTRSIRERSDYEDVALIQFKLAIRYSPPSSITARRARELIRRLQEANQTPPSTPSARPAPATAAVT